MISHFTIGPFHIYNDTLGVFNLVQFHHEALQLIVPKQRKYLCIFPQNEMQGRLFLQVNLPNKQLADVYVFL